MSEGQNRHYRTRRLRLSIGVGAFLWFTCFLPLPGGYGSSSNTLSVFQILDKVQQRYSVADFEADFTQSSRLDAVGIVDTAEGHVSFKPPAMMRWHYKTPDEYFIIADAQNVWVYRPMENQVMAGKAADYFGDRKFTDFFAEPKKLLDDFDIQWAPGQLQAEDYYVLRLLPRKSQPNLAEVFLFVSKTTFDIYKSIVFNAFGDQTTLRFSDFQFDQGLHRSLFEFKIPKGADVMQLDAP
jgi:outer membrane lipoprotein carrier protein